MADGVTADFTEVNRLAASLGSVAANAGPFIIKAAKVTAGKVKSDARDSVAAGSQTWRALPPTIDYDIEIAPSGVEVEVGYNKDKAAGPLGNIREYGSAQASPHMDLQKALEKNLDDFEFGLSRALEDAEKRIQ